MNSAVPDYDYSMDPPKIRQGIINLAKKHSGKNRNKKINNRSVSILFVYYDKPSCLQYQTYCLLIIGTLEQLFNSFSFHNPDNICFRLFTSIRFYMNHENNKLYLQVSNLCYA